MYQHFQSLSMLSLNVPTFPETFYAKSQFTNIPGVYIFKVLLYRHSWSHYVQSLNVQTFSESIYAKFCPYINHDAYWVTPLAVKLVKSTVIMKQSYTYVVNI